MPWRSGPLGSNAPDDRRDLSGPAQVASAVKVDAVNGVGGREPPGRRQGRIQIDKLAPILRATVVPQPGIQTPHRIIQVVPPTQYHKQRRLHNLQCSLLRVSKGGSAALYFGCKYGFPNIVTIVPQFLLGTYVSMRKPTGRFMLGDGMPPQHIAMLDRLLPGTVAADKQVARNIYLFISPAGYQYEEEIKPTCTCC